METLYWFLLTTNMKRRLTEIDMTGRIIRQYESSLCEISSVKCADVHGRILICDRHNRMELLDSEFNLLDFTGSVAGKGFVEDFL